MRLDRADGRRPEVGERASLHAPRESAGSREFANDRGRSLTGVAPSQALSHQGLLSLQRSAGNAAVANALSVSRAPAPAKAPKPEPAPEAGGIGEKFAVDQYAGVAQKLRENWARLTPHSRAGMLVTATNFELSHVDVPSTKFRLDDKLAPQTAGEFVSNQKDDDDGWTLLLNKTQFSNPSPESIDPEPVQEGEGKPVEQGEGKPSSAGGGMGLAGTVYHEARHAEQAFRIARLKAGMKWGAKAISETLDIPRRIAKEATNHPLKTDSKNEGEAREAREAETWLGGMTGSQGEEAAKIFKRMDEFGKKFEAAKAASEKLDADPNASEADKKKAEALVEYWAKRHNDEHAKYVKIPRESDSFKVEDRADSALGKAKK